MTYRLLDVDTEWPLIAHEFTSRDLPLPDPQFAMIVGAFRHPHLGDPPELVGFLVCQLQFHFEPLVLYPPHGYALRGLVRTLESELLHRVPGARYFAFAATPEIQGACLALGLSPVSMPLFYKSLAPAAPTVIDDGTIDVGS